MYLFHAPLTLLDRDLYHSWKKNRHTCKVNFPPSSVDYHQGYDIRPRRDFQLRWDDILLHISLDVWIYFIVVICFVFGDLDSPYRAEIVRFTATFMEVEACVDITGVTS